MQNKIQSAIENIKLGLANAGNPVIAWSGGKDSMPSTLLHVNAPTRVRQKTISKKTSQSTLTRM